MDESSISVVVPAHNEESVIGELLDALEDGRHPGDQIFVVCNGCTDRTAAIAHLYPAVRVIELPERGKPLALNAGDCQATAFPRFYVDADVVVTSKALHRVAAAMQDGVEAGAPRPVFDTARSSLLLRQYYRFWSLLPYLSISPLGSGVFGVTASGRRRFERFPALIADDEFFRRHFAENERLESCSESFVVRAPRTLAALARIKTRSRLGVLQLNDAFGESLPSFGANPTISALCLLRSPDLWFPFLVYSVMRFVVEVRAQIRHRRLDYSGWARDRPSKPASNTGSAAGH